MSDKNTKITTRLKGILDSFQKFQKKDTEIRQKAKDIFAKAKKRIDERKIEKIKEKIKNA